MTILWSDDLQDTITFVRKRQNGSNGNTNMYISPNIGIKMYKPTVLYVNTKYIVFKFEKKDHLTLCLLLRKISDNLKAKLHSTFYDLKEKHIYDIISETDDDFTIRCNIPGTTGKYFVKTNDHSMFRLPRVSAVYNNVVIEFRNYWEQNGKVGMNSELKYVQYDI
ncbi:hypothetical protein EB118_15875 [bacterium]|nr:hypothetical protein [bacterium]NDD83494.1 hypothetical protein [bacterium]NDG31534.1 hypothetical protein [bacterium]